MDPLYITGITNTGELLLGGVFQMKDQVGFPLDCSKDVCKENGLLIDYHELLCSAWLNDCLKFDSIIKEMLLLGVDIVNSWKEAGTVFLNKHPKAMLQQNPIDVYCRYTIQQKKLSGKMFDGFLSLVNRFSSNSARES